MAVYVDHATNPLGQKKMSHMLADTESELHAMAQAIGLKREWFQAHGTKHYDVCQAKRKLAVARGAVQVGRRELVSIIRRQRQERRFPLDGCPTEPSSSIRLCTRLNLIPGVANGPHAT